MERRLAAILNADVVGYSRLMVEDEAATVQALGRLRERVAQQVPAHHGRLVDFTGDNFLAEFPSALDAARCALALQGELAAGSAPLPPERRALLRIGIHLGDVRVEGERLFGTGVNLASRLQALAAAGEVCISAAVREQLRGQPGLACEDLGTRAVKNLPDPVHAYRLGPLAGDSPGAAAPAARRWRLRRVALAGAAGLLAATAFGLWITWPLAPGLVLDGLGFGVVRPPPAPPAEASIVVLPFQALGETVPPFLADGLTDDLTTDLAGIPDLMVIARNSAFAYRDATPDVRGVGRALGVAYVLQGTVRGDRERIRVNVSLSETDSARQVWSQRFERPRAAVLALQSEISEEILTALNLRVEAAELERIRRKPTESLSAYEAVKQANMRFYRFRREANQQARGLYQRAIGLDPAYAEAYALLANTYNYEFTGGWTQDPALLDQAEALVRKALELDPLSPQAFASLTAVHIAKGRWGEARAAGERCVELAPSYDFGHFLLAMAYRGHGEPMAAFRTFRRGLRLDPRGQAPTLAFLAELNYRAGRVEEAVASWERIRRENPHHIASRLALALHYQTRGQLAATRAALSEVLAINPAFQAERARLPGGRYPSDEEKRRLTRQLGALRAKGNP